MKNQKRVAVLGGGVASLASVWELVHRSEDVEVTVYQMGWRLGGKCASGRNTAIADRIEEHGLHILFGFYENAFDMYREVFDELETSEDDPLKSWKDAFVGKDSFTLAEHVGADWLPWKLRVPQIPGTPGDRAREKQPYAYTNFQEIARLYLQGVHSYIESRIAKHSGILSHLEEFLVEHIEKAIEHLDAREAKLLREAENLLEDSLPALWRLLEDAIEKDHTVRHLWVVSELGITIAKGLAHAYLNNQTREDLDKQDLLEWLNKHSAVKGGLSQLTSESAPLRMLFDLVFAYKDGDASKPSLEVGTAIVGAANILFNYTGHLYYQMQGGTGDVLAGTIYRVLSSEKYAHRVTFKFFHEVTHLALNAEKTSVERVDLGIQATTINGFYDPLLTVKGLPSWPSTPIYSQLREGDELQKSNELPANGGYNLESPWTAWPGVGKTSIELGRDYDDLIIGLPVGTLKTVASELRSNPGFAKMLDSVGTVATQSFQLWISKTVSELGAMSWADDDALVHGAFQSPHSNWADWTDLVEKYENWPADLSPRNLALMCGVLKIDLEAPAPGRNSGYIESQRARVSDEALDFVQCELVNLWPNAYDSNGFNFDLLVDPSDASGEARFNSQYRRANIAPWEQYTASFPGTGETRLRPDKSGFENVYLAGDWTKNSLNFGAVEASVISGRVACRGLLGRDYPVFGDPGPTAS